MLTPRLNRTAGTFEKRRLSHRPGVGICEQRFSDRGAQRGKPDRHLRGPAVTHHLTVVWWTFTTAAFPKACHVSEHWLLTFFLVCFQRPLWKSKRPFLQKNTHIIKNLVVWFPSSQIPMNSTHRLHWKILKKGISVFFSEILSYGENNNFESGKDCGVISDKRLFTHGAI